MVQTITPVVHGGSRKRWAVTLALHVLGAVASSALLGAVLGGTGEILGAPWGGGGMLVVAAVAAAYAAREFGLPLPIPELRRQVPQWWREAFSPRTSAFLYGLGLGPGFGTHLRHGTLVAVAAMVLAVGDPIFGAVALGAFGLARALAVSAASAARTPAAVGAVGDGLERLGAGGLPRAANATALVGLSMAALTTSLPGEAPAAWIWPAALAATFGWAAAAKVLRRERWGEALRAHDLPPWARHVAGPLVPALEAGVALLLLTDHIRAGALLAVFLLAAFTLGILRARTSGSLPCGCFGGRARRSVRWLVTRNAALATLALVTLALGSPVPVLSPPRAGDVLPAVLAVLGALLALSLLRAASLTSAGRVRR